MMTDETISTTNATEVHVTPEPVVLEVQNVIQPVKTDLGGETDE